MDTRSLERFLKKVSVDQRTGDWNWTGARSEKGYGQFWNEGHNNRSHRVSYEHFVGVIPEGYEIDHLCENESCCNPLHLEAVEGKINLMRKFLRREGVHNLVGLYFVKSVNPTMGERKGS